MRVVFIGDSLTEGTHGASYLAFLRRMLAETPGAQEIDLINAGIGGDTVEHLLARVATDVAPHNPDWDVVFVGTNDCTTWLISRGVWRRLVFWRTRHYFSREKGVSGAITPERFEAGLRALVAEIRQQTNGRIALCAPPPHGVDPRSPGWRLMARYADVVRRVSATMGCDLIDLHRKWSAVALGLSRQTPAQRRRATLGALWGDGETDIETLARERGYALTFDGVHFSTQGATLAAETFYTWLLSVMNAADTPDHR
jgi:lysophospholipase L1-like esterase